MTCLPSFFWLPMQSIASCCRFLCKAETVVEPNKLSRIQSTIRCTIRLSNKPEIHLVSIDTEVNGNKMTLEFIHTDMKAAAKAIQDLLEDKK